MKLSVIITTFNNPDYLKRVINALNAQDALPDEVIIADDGSGRDTADLIVSTARELKFPIVHVWQEDLGFRAARIRNSAILKSSGDYIVFLDGDCIPDRNFIKDHKSLAQRGCFVQGKRVLINRKSSVKYNYEMTYSTFSLLITGGLSNVHHVFRIPFPAIKSRVLKGIKTCNLSLFRDDIDKVNGFNEEFIGWGREDSEFAVRLFKLGLKKKVHPFRAICYHLWHEQAAREKLKTNNELLKKSIATSGFRCENGMYKDAVKPFPEV